MNRLRAIYPNALGMRLKLQAVGEDLSLTEVHTAKPMDQLFTEFFESLTERQMSEKQQAIVTQISHTVVAGGDLDETDPTGI